MGKDPTPWPLPQLKLLETEVDRKNPWSDSVLKRKELVNKLTVLVRDETALPPHKPPWSIMYAQE